MSYNKPCVLRCVETDDYNMQFAVMNISGSHTETAAKKSASKEEIDSGSDYEEVEIVDKPKSKASTLPPKLQPGRPL